MEKYEEIFKLAKKEIEVSDHLLYKTFSLIKDTKFLVAITEHVIKAASYALGTILEYEKYWKRIGPYPPNLGIQIKIYSDKIARKYKLDPKYVRLLNNLMEIKRYIKESPIRFKRQDKYILSTKDYETKSLDLDKVKRYFNLVKTFINDIEKVINENEQNSGSQKKAELRGLFA